MGIEPESRERHRRALIEADQARSSARRGYRAAVAACRAAVHSAHAAGMPYREIGEVLGISTSAAYQITKPQASPWKRSNRAEVTT